MFRIRRKPSGHLRMTLSALDYMLLRTLPGRLRNLIESPDFTDRAVLRLFPIAYDDPQKEAEYRRLLGDDLRERKLEGVEAFENSLRSVRLGKRDAEITISPEAFELWLGFVNDVRLIMGVELGIETDDWTESSVDPSHPRADELELLHYLTWLEECLLAAHGAEPPPGG